MEKSFISRNYLGSAWFMDDFITPLTVHWPVLLAIFVFLTVRRYLHVCLSSTKSNLTISDLLGGSYSYEDIEHCRKKIFNVYQ